MKAHLAWIQWTASAAIVAGTTAPAAAQYPPYRPLPPTTVTPPAATQPAAAQYPSQPLYRSATQPAMGQAPQVPYVAYREGSVQAQAQRYATTATESAPSAAATQPYQSTPYQSTPYQPYQSTPPAAPTNQSAVAPTRPSVVAYPQYPQYPQTTAPLADSYGRSTYVAQQPAPVPPQGDAHHGSTNAPAANGAAANGAPRNGSAAHAKTSDAYANGVYNSSAPACGDNYGGYGGGSYDTASSCDGGHQSMWFGGVYFLFMERDNSHPVNLAVAVPNGSPGPTFYPSPDQNVLVHSDYDFKPGVEVRFGCTFTIGDSCDTGATGCGSHGYGYGGCNSGVPYCSSDIYAWEVGWWGLDEDENNATYVVDQTTSGMYGLVNFTGLQYDFANDGYTGTETGANAYYGYGMPITAASPEVFAQCVRTNFQAQNLEFNIFRIPFCGPACGGCGSSGCDDGRMCAYSAYGSCGVRYFRIDDDFLYGTEFNGGTQPGGFDGWSFADDNELFYDVEVDNQLIGPQLGWTMNYSVGCKWNFFFNSTFGVFENHINSRQRMFSGGGGWAHFTQSGERFDIDSTKDDISFLGELRLGGSYDVTCNWRAVLAYRAVAATGLATSVGQIPANFSNSTAVGIINSNDSMIVHGVQIGAECRY